MSQPATPNATLEAVFAMLADAKAKLSDGVLVEMQTLERAVETLCAQAKEVTAPQRAAFSTSLAALYAELTELQEALIAAREHVQAQIGELPTMQRANKAYQATDASVPPAAEEE